MTEQGRPAKPRGSRQRAALGWCTVHEKVLFTSRKGARKARLFGSELTAYRCSVVEGFWHLGHLPPQVKDGTERRWG
jgi:hypothetical protein